MKIVGKRSEKQTKAHYHKCLLCGDDFMSYKTKSKVCSNECKIKYISIKMRKGKYIKCIICEKEFWKKPSEDRRGGQRKYCSWACMTSDKKLSLPYGEYLSYDGYIVVNRTTDGRKQIKKHRLIMEEHIGRKLSSKEIVHHKNENKLDNKIENLQIVSRSEHNIIHKKLRASAKEALN